MTAALASAYNGIIGSPLFTAVLATEVAGTKKNRLLFLGWNLLAGVIGYFIFILSGLHSFLGEVPFPPLQTQNIVFVVYAIILGAIGALLVVFLAIAFQFFGKLMKRFNEKVVLRALVAGVITAVVVYFIPEVAFSGETQIHTIVGSAAQFGIATLLLYAVLKILLLAVAFKGGFLGGPTFPILFSCTMIGLAIGLAFPSLPIILLSYLHRRSGPHSAPRRPANGHPPGGGGGVRRLDRHIPGRAHHRRHRHRDDHRVVSEERHGEADGQEGSASDLIASKPTPFFKKGKKE